MIRAAHNPFAGPVHQHVSDPLSEGVCVLGEYGLELRIVNSLEKAGYLYVRDLTEMTRADALGMAGIGKRTVDKLATALGRFVAYQNQ